MGKAFIACGITILVLATFVGSFLVTRDRDKQTNTLVQNNQLLNLMKAQAENDVANKEKILSEFRELVRRQEIALKNHEKILTQQEKILKNQEKILNIFNKEN